MILKLCEFISIILSALVGGLYWGPWLALSRSFNTFSASVFLEIVTRMNRNMASLMAILTPVALLSIIPVLLITYREQPETFTFFLIGFVLFLIALLVTVLIEVPIVKQMVMWPVSTPPDNWQQLRDRWGTFHIVRVVAGIGGLILLVIGGLF